MKWCRHLLQAVLLTALAVGSAYAQGTTTSSITGTVTDSGGGVIPGATVNVEGEAGVKATVVTNADGVFTVPALIPGTYKVTVTLQGFKTAIIENVRVVAGNPANVPVKLEVVGQMDIVEPEKDRGEGFYAGGYGGRGRGGSGIFGDPPSRGAHGAYGGAR